MKRLTFAFYNLAPAGAPDRGPLRVEMELKAISNRLRRDPDRPRPKVIGLCEAIGRSLPELDGYTKFHDRSTRPRANIAVYTRDDLEVEDLGWFQHSFRWPRTKHFGLHEPRSDRLLLVNGWLTRFGHAPPDVRGAGWARSEWLASNALWLHGKHPKVLLSDPNGLGDDLVRRVGRDVVAGGTGIEAVHGRNVTLTEVHTPGSVNGIAMLSDHKKCLLGTAVRR